MMTSCARFKLKQHALDTRASSNCAFVLGEIGKAGVTTTATKTAELATTTAATTTQSAELTATAPCKQIAKLTR